MEKELLDGRAQHLEAKLVSADENEEPEALDSIPPSEEPEALDSIPPSEEPEALDSIPPSEEPEVLDSIPPSEEPEVLDSIPPSEEPEVLDSIPPSEEPEVLDSIPPSEEPEVLDSIPPSEEPEVLDSIPPSEDPKVLDSIPPSEEPEALDSIPPSEEPEAETKSVKSLKDGDEVGGGETEVGTEEREIEAHQDHDEVRMERDPKLWRIWGEGESATDGEERDVDEDHKPEEGGLDDTRSGEDHVTGMMTEKDFAGLPQEEEFAARLLLEQIVAGSESIIKTLGPGRKETADRSLTSKHSDRATINTKTQHSFSSVPESPFSSEVASEFSIEEKKERIGDDSTRDADPAVSYNRRHTIDAWVKKETVVTPKKHSLDQKLKGVENLAKEGQAISFEKVARFVTQLEVDENLLRSSYVENKEREPPDEAGLQNQLPVDDERIDSVVPPTKNEEPLKEEKRVRISISEKTSPAKEEQKDREKKSILKPPLERTETCAETLVCELSQPQLEAFHYLYSKINRPHRGGISARKLLQAFEEFLPRVAISESDAAQIVSELDRGKSDVIGFEDFIFTLMKPNNYIKLLLKADLKYLEAELKIWNDITSQTYKFKPEKSDSKVTRFHTLFLRLAQSVIKYYTLREIRIFYFDVITRLNDLAIQTSLADKYGKFAEVNRQRNNQLVEVENWRQHRKMFDQFTKDLPPDQITRSESLTLKRLLKKKHPRFPHFQLTLRARAIDGPIEELDLNVRQLLSDMSLADEMEEKKEKTEQPGVTHSLPTSVKEPTSVGVTGDVPDNSKKKGSKCIGGPRLFNAFMKLNLKEYPGFRLPKEITNTEIDDVTKIKQKAAQSKEDYYRFLRKTAAVSAKNVATQIEVEHRRRRFAIQEDYGPIPKQFIIASTGTSLPKSNWRPSRAYWKSPRPAWNS